EHRRGEQAAGAGRDRQRDFQCDRPPHEGPANHARQNSGGARMKSFTNTNPRDLAHALTLVRQTRQGGRTFAFAGGGSDLLGMMKDRLVTPDVVVNLKAIAGLDQVQPDGGGAIVGGLITLDALSRDPLIRRRYPVLAEAAESVATPQIRNVGTLAGNVCQRPWCWYYR